MWRAFRSHRDTVMRQRHGFTSWSIPVHARYPADRGRLIPVPVVGHRTVHGVRRRRWEHAEHKEHMDVCRRVYRLHTARPGRLSGMETLGTTMDVRSQIARAHV